VADEGPEGVRAFNALPHVFERLQDGSGGRPGDQQPATAALLTGTRKSLCSRRPSAVAPAAAGLVSRTSRASAQESAGLIGADRGQGVEDVRDLQDAGQQRSLLAAQTVRVSRAVQRSWWLRMMGSTGASVRCGGRFLRSLVVWVRITAHSSSESGPGLKRMESGWRFCRCRAGNHAMEGQQLRARQAQRRAEEQCW